MFAIEPLIDFNCSLHCPFFSILMTTPRTDFTKNFW